MAEEAEQKQVLSYLCPSGRELKPHEVCTEGRPSWLNSPLAVSLKRGRHLPSMPRSLLKKNQFFCQIKWHGYRFVTGWGKKAAAAAAFSSIANHPLRGLPPSRAAAAGSGRGSLRGRAAPGLSVPVPKSCRRAWGWGVGAAERAGAGASPGAAPPGPPRAAGGGGTRGEGCPGGGNREPPTGVEQRWREAPRKKVAAFKVGLFACQMGSL